MLRFYKHHKKYFSKKESYKSKLISFLLTAVFAFAGFYLFLPALNIFSISFWFYLISTLVFYIFVKSIITESNKENGDYKISGSILALCIVIVVLAGIFGLKIWHAKSYASILKVEEGQISDIPSVEGTSSIALMDTASAEKLGDRKIGSLTDVVSQFSVGEYVQIDFQSSPVKVAALEYEGFFKWFGNNHRGIPGFVKVDPVSMSADYTALNKGMKYVPSAYFNEDINRHIRFKYPTVMFGNTHFEIDEEGNPWYIASVYEHTISLFGGKKVTGAIFVNPVSGDITRLNKEEIPIWADVIFPGDLIVDQYNDYGKLQRGFLNSIFGQIDSKQTTSVEIKDEEGEVSYHNDYGYIAKNGDIWIYTGVTSVNGDSSNLGFIMANERTGETRYIISSGADEASAMKSSEGEVQEKGYHASFPSLINIDGIPTYIMVLKDDNGLVKMYSCVNVEQYNLVVTASTQKDAIEQYRKMINGEITIDDANNADSIKIDTSKFESVTITVSKLEKIDINGDTYLYVVSSDGKIYKAKYADVIKMISVNAGDTITILTDGNLYTYEE